MPQTPEEAAAYRENYLTGMRSGIRGPVQGIASLAAMGDVPALLELGAYEQAGLPAYERGLIDYEDIPRAGYGETRQKHLETIGEAVVPGETIESGVHGSQLLTELAGIGVIGKQAVDLIRKYGPLAVTRIKSIFARKPGATVDDAVNEAMKVTRRDVLQTGGAGIAALAVPGAALKLGTAATKAPVAAKSIMSMINKIPDEILKKTATFGGPLKGGKMPPGYEVPGVKAWNKDWSLKIPWDDTLHSTPPAFVDRVMMASKPHFEKHGLKPNEITRMSRYGRDEFEYTLSADPDAWTIGNKQQFLDKRESGLEKVGEMWHLKLDIIKNGPKETPTLREMQMHTDDFRMMQEEVALIEKGEHIFSLPRTFAKDSVKNSRYLGEAHIPPEHKGVGHKGRTLELFEIDGIPVVRHFDDIYLPNMKGMERLSGSKKMLQKELEAEEIVERAMDKMVEGIKDTPRPEKVQKIIDAKRKAEGKAHGGFVDKAIAGGERYI